jgi:hypothetical protein
MQLTADADRLVRTYSGGMRRRIDLGISLVGTPAQSMGPLVTPLVFLSSAYVPVLPV